MTDPEPQRGAYWAQQSPIDINDSIYTKGLRPLRFDYADEVHGVFGDPGHDPGHSFDLLPGSVAHLEFADQRCPLLRIHLHAPSEHQIDGSSYPMELHLVHKISRPVWGSTAVVVAVFVQEHASASAPILQHFMKNRDSGPGSPVALDPNLCIPEDRGFFRYEGSLTTPAFAEQVSWVVLRTPLSALRPELEALRKRAGHPARPIQPLQRRFVLRSFADLPHRRATGE